MTLLALGDTHGRNDWQRIISHADFDRLVLIGDYFDTHEDVSPEQQLANFDAIVTYKRARQDKVVLLIGNHDFHYLRTARETYSGFQRDHQTQITTRLHRALESELLQVSFLHDSYLFTHAGVTNTWLDSVGYAGEKPVDRFLNTLFTTRPDLFRFTVGANYSPYGDDRTQPPIWVRPKSLLADALEGYTQVVGHTPQTELLPDPAVTLIDTLGTSKQFLAIVDGQMIVREQDW